MNKPSDIASIVVFTLDGSAAYRRIASHEPLTTAKQLSIRYPGRILGVFEDPTGKTGEAMFHFPEACFLR